MLNNITLQKINSKNFNEFYNYLEQDFCFEERKTKKNELKTLSNKCFNPNFIYLDNNLIGYICFWNFTDFIYVEHFAILKEKRNKGYGSKFLAEFLANIKIPVVGEIERPTCRIKKRRLNFYKKLGFCVNEFNYFQPSYHNSTDSIPMYLISYNKHLTLEEYNKYITIIKNAVYT